MTKNINIVLKAILAGIIIGIAGNVYLSLYNSYYIIGAFLFSFALLVIVSLDYNLYTGKVGYLIDNKGSYIKDLLLIILGNFIGIGLIVSILLLSNNSNVSIAQTIVQNKIDSSWYEIFLYAIICGMLMYIGVEGYRRISNEFSKILILMFAVVIFIFSGYEHSIANIFYILLSKTFDVILIPYFLLMLLGNGMGAILLNFLEKKVNLR